MEPKEKKPSKDAAAVSSPAKPFEGAKDKVPCAKSGLAGRKAVFVVDDCDMKIQSVALPYAFGDSGWQGGVKPSPYSSFLSNPTSVVADAIVLHDSRIFINSEEKQKELIAALRELRKANPESVIIFCSISYTRRLDFLVADGTIDVLDHGIPSPQSLLEKAEEIVRKRRGE